MKICDIRTFIPCKDYEQSKLFYKSLGFKGESAGDDMIIFEKDGCTFFLQRNFYSEEFSKNLMLQLIAADINEAYEVVSQITVNDAKHSDLKQERWGKVVYLWGHQVSSGILHNSAANKAINLTVFPLRLLCLK